MAKNETAKAANNSEAKVSHPKRNEVEGRVVSDKMQKTISVQVYSLVRHERYSKYVRRSNVFKAHDEKNEAKTGDLVKIFETRPLSKTKRWTLASIVEKRKQVAGVDI